MRRRERPGPTADDLPEALRLCWTEDWLATDEVPAHDERDPDVWMTAQLTAWMRWQAAQRAWAAEHGLSLREMGSLVTSIHPRWRRPPLAPRHGRARV